MEHYYSEKQSSEFKPAKIKIRLKNDLFEIYSAQGVFSKSKLDIASKLLIESSQVPENGDILDIGCGYGIIGISLLRNNSHINITFSDVNERALELTKMNLKKLGYKGKVIKSDVFKNISEKYDCILSNPPMAAGRKICFKLIEDAKKHLNDRGSIQIVARHQKGGKVLMNKMKDVFGNVDTVAKSSGFRVYKSILK